MEGFMVEMKTFWAIAKPILFRYHNHKVNIKLHGLGWYFRVRNSKLLWSLYTVLLYCMIFLTRAETNIKFYNSNIFQINEWINEWSFKKIDAKMEK